MSDLERRHMNTEMKLVPVEPTEEMKVAGCKEDDILGELVDWRGDNVTTRDAVARVYRAMLAAAPDPWQPIETAPKDGRSYEVSTSGAVRVDGILRVPYTTDKGYLRVTIGGKSVPVHRLVAAAFIPNPLGHKEVNHLDGDKTNNAIRNLEWCSRSDNMKHAYANGLHPGVRLRGEQSPNWMRNGTRHPQSMPVRAVFPDGSWKDYESQGLAAKDGFSSTKISQCVNGKRKSHGGAVWMPLPAPPADGGGHEG